MTLEELLQIIKKKKVNAVCDLIEKSHLTGENISLGKLQGTIDAYTDLIYLIESELNKEKK